MVVFWNVPCTQTPFEKFDRWSFNSRSISWSLSTVSDLGCLVSCSIMHLRMKRVRKVSRSNTSAISSEKVNYGTHTYKFGIQWPSYKSRPNASQSNPSRCKSQRWNNRVRTTKRTIHLCRISASQLPASDAGIYLLELSQVLVRKDPNLWRLVYQKFRQVASLTRYF